MSSSPLAPADRDFLIEHFSDDLQDVRAIAARDTRGRPTVVQVAPLRTGRRGDRTPCPTTFWLVCPDAKRRVSHLEAAGWIGRLEARVAEDADLRARFHEDHRRYARRRAAAVTPEEQAFLAERDWLAPFDASGIGGIRNPDAIKCLHLHWAHHLVEGSLVGEWITALLEGRE